MSSRRGILIVDDEAILLLAIRQELRLAFGTSFVYETAINAERGLDALKALTAKGVDVAVIISDWLMPGMRGDEFLRIARTEYPDTKLVMLSGHADAAQMEGLDQDIGLYARLSKPYRRNALTELVKGVLIP
jgi:DNA-binding NarL/FixJ family response regulator